MWTLHPILHGNGTKLIPIHHWLNITLHPPPPTWERKPSTTWENSTWQQTAGPTCHPQGSIHCSCVEQQSVAARAASLCRSCMTQRQRKSCQARVTRVHTKVGQTDMAVDKTPPWRCSTHTAGHWQASGPACHPGSSLPQHPRSRLGSRPLEFAAEGDLAMTSGMQDRDNWSQRSGTVSTVKVKASQCQPCMIHKIPSCYHVHKGILH